MKMLRKVANTVFTLLALMAFLVRPAYAEDPEVVPEIEAKVFLPLVVSSSNPSTAVSTSNTDPADSTIIQIPMQLDCSNLSGSALEYAQQHDYCPSDDEVAASDSRSGTCGWTMLYIQNLGRGQASFSMGVGSYLGAISQLYFNTVWTNWSNGSTGSVSDFAFPNATTWTGTRIRYTGPGFVSSTMTGYAKLWWGANCYFLNPTDDDTITG